MVKKKKRKPRPYRPGVIVCEEKHGVSLYWAITEEQRDAQALAILTQRFNEGYWYLEPEEEHYGKPELTVEQAEALPDGEIKKKALQQHSSWERQRTEFLYAKEGYELIKAAVENKDGALAWQLLRGRSSYEYEGIDLEYPSGDLAPAGR